MTAASEQDGRPPAAALAADAAPDAFAGAGIDESLWFVDPELRPGARLMQQMTVAVPPISAQSLSAWRTMDRGFDRPLSATIMVDRRSIAGPPGAPPVTIYVINAKTGSSRAAILHLHGGGYFMGSAAGLLGHLQAMSGELDCCIVSVDYRLAPETRYAGSLEDNYAALRWLADNAPELGVDRARVAVMGESAGGGHAALLAIAARDRGEFPLAFQLLAYPMLDDRTGSTRSVPAPIGTLAWTAESNRYGWRAFTGHEPGSPDVPVAAVPARNPDLRGLPPAFIGVGSIDLFVQEDVDYARRLIEAGVPTELFVVPGAYHAFDGIAPGSTPAKRFARAKMEALRRGLAIPA